MDRTNQDKVEEYIELTDFKPKSNKILHTFDIIEVQKLKEQKETPDDHKSKDIIELINGNKLTLQFVGILLI